MKKILLSILLSAHAVFADQSTYPPLTTKAEVTQWKQTGRYEEVLRLCNDFAKNYAKQVRCIDFGKSPEGRLMVALVASGDGTLEAKKAKAKNRPVIVMQGGIHAGEIDGKDAGFYVLREILKGNLLPKVLDKVTLVFVPVFNVDGHERFGKHNRPNQIGPEEMGWRTTAQNLNLNRDYAKAETPEMMAMLNLLNEWDPMMYVDLHVTDGAQFQHDIAVMVDPSDRGPLALRKLGQEIEDEVMKKLKAKEHLPLPFYPSFNVEDDPASGIKVDVPLPRFSNGYWPLRNRFAVLVETHSWKDYATRVKATSDTIVALLELASQNGKAWLEVARDTDRESDSLAGKEIDLTFETTDKFQTIDFFGYDYKRELSSVSGKLKTVYDISRNVIWKTKLFTDLKPQVTVKAPKGGYIVPPAHVQWVSQKLNLHGIKFNVIKQPKPAMEVETFRASEVSFGKMPFEGRISATVKGSWNKEKRDVVSGSIFIPISQPYARLILTLLEPTSSDSFVYWGFFNTMFEMKEYMESYVAEQLAQEMLAKDPKIKQEFVEKLEKDPDFAKSPDDRLEFFYRKHPSWDERVNLYPILRSEQLLQ